MRRLPVYFLLDCSESMAGEALALMEKGIQSLLSTLRRDPAALEMAYISVITFASRAKQILPLTELCSFQMPKLVLGSGTAMGAGIDLLNSCISREVVKTTLEQRGDYKPIVFIMTDGDPTDNWHKQADSLLYNRHIQTVIIGLGQDVNIQNLGRISENVIYSKDTSEQNLSQFFKWVSDSVSSASQAIDNGREGKVNLEKFPQSAEMIVVTEETPIPQVIPGKYLFLHIRCAKSKKFYAAKYVKTDKKTASGQSCVYDPVCAYPMDDFDFTENDNSVVISTEQMNGFPPCPYCGNICISYCNCGKIFCCTPIVNEAQMLTCPWCGKTERYAPATFDIGSGGG